MDKKILKIMILIVIILITFAGILLTIKTNHDKKEEQRKLEEQEQIIQVEEVNSASLYYTACDCVDKFLLASHQKDEEVLYDILDKEYIEKNSLSKENIIENLDSYEQWYKINCLEMKLYANEDYYRYFILGQLVIPTTQEVVTSDFSIIVNMDMKTRTFSIIPKYDTTKIEEYKSIIGYSIEANDNNKYDYQSISNDKLLRKYINKFMLLLNNNDEAAYELLDKTYREARFGGIKNFRKYLKEYKDELIDITSFEYAMEDKGEYTEYVIKDKTGNYFFVDEYEVNNFKIRLDSYTIKSEDWQIQYKRGSNTTKVGMNIELFFEMINKKDYSAAYNCLAEGFRDNYFKSQEDFEEYIKNNFKNCVDIEYITVTNTGDIYFYDIEIKDIETNKKTRNTMIMRLDDDGFALSFNAD